MAVPIFIWLLAYVTTMGAILPLVTGCSLESPEPVIRCRSNNLEYIVKTLFALVPESRFGHVNGNNGITVSVNSNGNTVAVNNGVSAAMVNNSNNNNGNNNNNNSAAAPPVANGGPLPVNATTTGNGTAVANGMTLNGTALNGTAAVTASGSNSSDVHAASTNSSLAATTTGAPPPPEAKVLTTVPPIVEPREVDIFYCDVPELPNIFSRFNSSLERIRVARSNVQSLTINSFEGLEQTLKHLDLSGNKLRTVPLAVQNLTRLEVLILKDNKIQVIAEGPTFANTRHLRELHLDFNNMGFIDAGRLQLFPSNNRKSNQHIPIGLTVFNLANITNTLEVLNLRGNGMHSYPEQLLTDFPRLKTLDLSFNSLFEVPEDAFRAMPELQSVNLDSNSIRTLKFNSLPETLKLFTMKNNPMRCDCDVKWILDWIFTNTSLSVLLPKCNAPFHLREISFLRLTGEKLCNESYVARQTVYVTDRDLGNFPPGVFQSFKLLDVRGEYRSLFLSWRVDPQFYLSQREWVILYRSFDDSIYKFNRTVFVSKSYLDNSTDWTSVERIFSDSIRNLTGGQFYQVCMAVVENNINYVHLNHCRVAQTEKEVVSSHQFAALEPPTPADGKFSSTTTAPDPDYLIESNFARIKAESHSITLFWNVTVQSRQSRLFYKESMAAAAAGSNRSATSSASFIDFPQESPLVLNTLTAIYNELKWKITYRRFASSTSDAVTIMKNNYKVTGPNTHQYTIANLIPGTGYSVCFETVNELSAKGNRLLMETSNDRTAATVTVTTAGGNGVTAATDAGTKNNAVPRLVELEGDGSVCREIETVAEKKFPNTEVAIASTVTAAVTIVVISLLFCLVPRYFRKKKKKTDDDAENASESTANTDAGGGRKGGPDDISDDSDMSDDEDDVPQVSGGYGSGSGGGGSKWKKNSYPRLSSIFPTEGYRNGIYTSSLRAYNNGIPPYPGYQKNGTYPKSILKKSPSAPVLSEAGLKRPVPILKRPSSVDNDSTSDYSGSSSTARVASEPIELCDSHFGGRRVDVVDCGPVAASDGSCRKPPEEDAKENGKAASPQQQLKQSITTTALLENNNGKEVVTAPVTQNGGVEMKKIFTTAGSSESDSDENDIVAAAS